MLTPAETRSASGAAQSLDRLGRGSGEVLVWIPALVCLAMVALFLLQGAVTVTRGEVRPAGSGCDVAQDGSRQC